MREQPRSSRSNGAPSSVGKTGTKRSSRARPSEVHRTSSPTVAPPLSQESLARGPAALRTPSSGASSRLDIPAPVSATHPARCAESPEVGPTGLLAPQPPFGSPSSFRGRADQSTSSSILVTNASSGAVGPKNANPAVRSSRAGRLDGAVLEAAVHFPTDTQETTPWAPGAASPLHASGTPRCPSCGVRRRFESSLTSHSSALSSPRAGAMLPQPRASLRVHLSRRAFIGKGSFGVVYKAMDTDTNQLLAVKEIALSGLVPVPSTAGSSAAAAQTTANEKRLAIVKKELAFLRQLNHPNIVQCLGEEIENDCLRIYMEYVPGGSVSSLLKTFGAFQERQASAFARQILHGLAYLHAKNIMHRDLKGDNLLVDTRGQLKLADFGTARDLTNTAATTNAALVGTAYFAAPETVHGNAVDAKADIWSTACCVIEMLTGSPPLAHIDNQYAIMMMLAQADETLAAHYIPEDNDWSDPLLDFIQLCLQKDPAARPTAQDLLRHEWIVRPPLRDSSRVTQDDDVLAVTVTSVALPDPIPAPDSLGSAEDSMLDVTGIGPGSPSDLRSPAEESVMATDAPPDAARLARKEKKRKKADKLAKSKDKRRAKSVGATPASPATAPIASLGFSSRHSSSKVTAADTQTDSPFAHTTSHGQSMKDRSTEAEAMSAGFLPPLSPSLRITPTPSELDLVRDSSRPQEAGHTSVAASARRSQVDSGGTTRRESKATKRKTLDR